MIRYRGVIIDRGNTVDRGRTSDYIYYNGKYKYFKRRGGRRSNIFNLLCILILGDFVTTMEIIDILFGRRKDGGPETAYNMIQVYMSRDINNIMSDMGLKVSRLYAGENLCRYHVEVKWSGVDGDEQKEYAGLCSSVSIKENTQVCVLHENSVP